MSDWPIIETEEKENILKLLEQGVLWKNEGSYVKSLEAKFSDLLGSSYGLAVTSGTHGLEIALTACGVGYGDEVLLPGISFYSTLSSIISVNAIPKFVDVLPETGLIDVEALDETIHEKTKAVIVVHLWGIPCDIEGIRDLCSRKGVALIEDCAHVGNVSVNGRALGTFGDAGVFSFQNAKLLAAGEGGFLAIQKREYYERALLLSNCGRTEVIGDYNHQILASNFRMTEFQGAVLLSQIDKYPERDALRKSNSLKIIKACNECTDLILPTEDMVNRSANYMFLMRFSVEKKRRLQDFIDFCAQRDVRINRVYPPLNGLSFLREGAFLNRISSENREIIMKSAEVDLQKSVNFYEGSVGIMHFNLLSTDFCDRFIDCVKEFFV